MLTESGDSRDPRGNTAPSGLSLDTDLARVYCRFSEPQVAATASRRSHGEGRSVLQHSPSRSGVCLSAPLRSARESHRGELGSRGAALPDNRGMLFAE